MLVLSYTYFMKFYVRFLSYVSSFPVSHRWQHVPNSVSHKDGGVDNLLGVPMQLNNWESSYN